MFTDILLDEQNNVGQDFGEKKTTFIIVEVHQKGYSTRFGILFPYSYVLRTMKGMHRKGF